MSVLKRIVCLVSIAAIFLFISSENASAQATEDTVKKALTEYDAAWNRKDSKFVNSMLAPGYVYFTSTGRTVNRKATMEFLSSAKYILREAKRSEVETFSAGNTVVLGSRWQGVGSFDGKEFNDDQRCSLVFTKEGKKWLLLSEHCTQIAPE